MHDTPDSHQTTSSQEENREDAMQSVVSFTDQLAAGSEAGNLSMPYYATPYHTMPFYYAIAILLQHWHPQHTMTLAIQVANWVYQGGPLHNQCGLHVYYIV